MIRKIGLVVFTALILCSVVHTSMAQKSISGMYNVSSGNPEGGNTFLIFDDHRFVVAFFGGVITGSWAEDGNQINFKPFTNEHKFYVYGRYNENLKDSSRIFFKGFEKEPTFIGFETQQTNKAILRPVYNPGPSCVPYPSTAMFYGKPTRILFSHKSDKGDDQALTSEVYSFDQLNKNNDFVAIYHRDDQDKRPFTATFKDGMLFFNGQDEGSKKQPLPTAGEDFEFIKQVLNAPQTVDKLFYSPFFHETVENLHDQNKWRYDVSKNAYINFQNYVEGEENRLTEMDAYNMPNIIFQFDILKLTDKKPVPSEIEEKPVMIATCY